MLGVNNALEHRKEVVAAIYTDKIHIKEGSEGLLDKISLVLSHKTLIDKNAGELLADGTAEKCSGNGAVNAARKTENDFFVANFFTELFNGCINEAVHLPVTCAAANIENKVSEHLIAVLGMSNLGVELNSIDLSVNVLHCSAGAVVGFGYNLKALGRFGDIIRMAHPNNTLFGNVLPKKAVLAQLKLNLAVFGNRSGCNLAVAHPCDELTAVADAENRNADVKNIFCIMRRFHIKNRVRSAGEDDSLVAVCLDRLKVGGVGENLGVNIEITDSAGDELIVLSAEIEDKYFFVHYLRPF